MAKRGRPRKVQFELEKESAHSIAGVVVVLLGLLALLSFFGQTAGFGSLVQELLNRYFGWGAVIFPILLILAGLALLRKTKWKFTQPRVVSGLVFLWLSFLGFTHFFFKSGVAKEEAVDGRGGGLLGYWIQKNLRTYLGSPGSFLVLFAAFLISLLVIFNASLDDTIIFAGKLLSFVGSFFEEHIFRNAVGFVKKLLGREVAQEEAGETEQREVEGEEQEQEQEEEVLEEVKDIKEEEKGIEIIETRYSLAGAKPVGGEEKTTTVSEKKKKKQVVGKEGKTLRQETVTNVPEKAVAWQYPPLDLLHDMPEHKEDAEGLKRHAQTLEDTLESFGIRAKVADVNVGPSVTQFALEAPSGTKLTKITNLQKDLAMALASSTGSVRIEAPIPGRSLVGVEVPNKSPSLVGLKKVITSEVMEEREGTLAVALGKDVTGTPQVADISRMPHVLIAGATGSGKSVLIHSFITSLLFRTTPEEARLILVDPKRVELSVYQGIPHLLSPVIVDAEKMLPTLKWAADEMERRYQLFQNAGAKDIDSYNELSGFQALPYIVIIVDELADIMALSANEVEKAIVRLAQMSRATGIHLVLSTQRPSTDVLTGLIKANITCRIALNTTSSVDSRVILDQPGADKLLGRGDLLFLPPEASKPRRIQGAFVSMSEIKSVVKFLKEKNEEREEFDESLREAREDLQDKVGEPFAALQKQIVTEGPSGKAKDWEDELFPEAVKVICRHDRGSASLLQRRLSIGYARAARLLDALEKRGAVTRKDGSKPRDVLISGPEDILPKEYLD
ncbi:MAG: DNA translocase FtsK 4TM domain-containing protein [Patescibacteria group bacterium]